MNLLRSSKIELKCDSKFLIDNIYEVFEKNVSVIGRKKSIKRK